MQDELSDILAHYPEVTGIHPACLAVPEIGAADKEKLEKSIADHGLRHEILLTADGQLIDGRNRLVACYKGQIEPRFRKVTIDPWQVAYAENIARRHLQVGQIACFGLAWLEDEKKAAKERMRLSEGRGAVKEKGVETLPHLNGKSRDKIGERVGVSGKSIDKAAKIAEVAPDIMREVTSGEITLEQGYREATIRERLTNSKPVEKPQPTSDEMTEIVTANGKRSQIALPKKVVFNATNDSVDWASWTWNPVTGCEHGCRFCYAREIAHSERMADYYPNKFEPTFHEYRLAAPANTTVPKSDDKRDGRVFVCSMADLFGKWVPTEWIRKVFDACERSPEWEYLFLTKWPARYSQMPLIDKAWYGASIIQQSDVKRVESAMAKIDDDRVIRWVSMEPLLEPISFTDLSWCDLVVIGSQTSTTQPDGVVPAIAPEFDWIVDVVNQCREAEVPYYLKANVGLDRPGMALPKSAPRVRRVTS